MAVGEASNTNAVSRRNAIKAAAAVGVGAAAWTGPQVGVFGATPAYAAVCSPSNVANPLGEFNTITATGTASATGCGGTRFRLDNLDANLGPSITLEGVARPITYSAASPCANGANTPLGTITVAGVECRVTVNVTDGTDSFTISSAVSTLPGGVVQIPQVRRNDGVPGQLETTSTYNVTLSCRTDSGCAFP